MGEVFTNDPINRIKWAVVFAVLIVSFIISGKIIKKLSYYLQGEKEINDAEKKGHVIPNARLVESRKHYESMEKRYKAGRRYSGTYEYELNGEVCRYHAYFGHKNPPKTVTLYYKNDPKKLFCMEEYNWNPFGGIVYLFFIFMPFLMAAFTALALDIPLYEGSESVQEGRMAEMTDKGGVYEGSLTHNGITVHFKTPELCAKGGAYEWYTYYTDKEEKTDVKIEFGFIEALPEVPEGSRREDCELWGKEMLYETVYVPFEDEYGDMRNQEKLFAYWQPSEDTLFVIAATGMEEELSNAYAQLINDEKFRSSFEIGFSEE